MKTKSIVLGGGCYWCLDASFRLVNGVVSSTCGFAGGELPDPTYEAVCYGRSDHAEVVRIEYDTDILSLEQVLDIFWALHDPTTLNRQGHDVGPQYRSALYFEEEEDELIIQDSLRKAQELWSDPIVTEVKKLEKFYEADEYHQDYFAKNPEKAYCQIVINPKLTALRQKFQTLLKM